MKELSIEQKAKEWSETKNGYYTPKELCEEIFSELKESEEQRIRKEFCEDIWTFIPNEKAHRYIAWLAKQGEHANFLSKIQVGDKVTRNEAGILVNLSQLERIAKPRRTKPVDKVEPKFHEGDWVVGANNVFKIISLNNELNCYIAVTPSNEEVKIPYQFDDGQGHMCSYHLWTIQDAHDGDVLAIENRPFIYNGKVNPLSVGGYCGITVDGLLKFYEECLGYGSKGWTMFDGDIYPATKEQCDILMKAMADAGYAFDFEKKELKRIEEPRNFKNQVRSKITDLVEDYIIQKPTVWSEEDDNCLSTIISEFSKCSGKSVSKDEWMRCNDFLNSLKDRVQPQLKQEWKQENTDDLTDFENAMMHIGGSFFGQYAGLDPNDTNEIKKQAKFLLEFVPKQEWSEEDNRMRKAIIDNIKAICEEGYFVGNIGSDELIDWLKSIRPQKINPRFPQYENIVDKVFGAGNLETWEREEAEQLVLLAKEEVEKALRPQKQWKPSEGQLECLGYAIEKAEKDWSPLINNRIYLTLKALKEQLEKL